MTHYQRPGFVPLVYGPNAPVRGLYSASNGNGYAVIGNGVYFISKGWGLAQLGTLQVTGSNPVSFIDNGIDILLVDGSAFGYTIAMNNNTFGILNDPTGTFVGADKVDYIDTFIVGNIPGTNQFFSTYSNELVFDPLYIAGKTGYPDLLQTIYINRHLLLLIGTYKSEIWYDAGNANFPFAELPGSYYEQGCIAKYSVASQDIDTFWISQNLQGQGVVVRVRGYECKRISNHALEYQFRQIVAAAGPQALADARGYVHQFDGHVFYVLNFPTADQTWAYDCATDQWAQRGWTDSSGIIHRDRGNCGAFINGTNVVGDWENGTIYQLDPNSYTDTVSGAAGPISFIRTFPHIGAGEMNLGAPGLSRPVMADGKRVRFDQFLLDIECGLGPLDVFGNPAKVQLRWSDDRGRTFGNALLQTTGLPGQYLSQPQWLGLGIARDRIFEIEHSIAGPAALNGAWVQGEVLQS
jgi:hypothetical protein